MGLAGLWSMRGPLRAPRASVALIVALIGGAIALAFGCTSSPAASNSFFGIAAGAQKLDAHDFRKMHAAGAGRFRFGVRWAVIQPRQSVHDWSRTDQLMGVAAAHGLRPLPVLSSSPSWVTRKPNNPPVGSARKVRAWRAFVADAARRYGPHGTYWRNGYQRFHPGEKPKPVKAWQIWNEPNLPKFFAARHPAKAYATVVKSAHKALARSRGHAKVVLAGMPGTTRPAAWTFLNHLYRMKGIKRSFSAAALHPYARSIHDFRIEIRRTRRVMRRHHDGRAGLWLTEFGWGSARPTRSRPLNKGRHGQKRMLQKSFRLVLHHRKRWQIQSLFWFDFRDPRKNTGGCTFCDSAGLLKHNRNPKPAYRAFKRLAR
jgi:hypothetical protein